MNHTRRNFLRMALIGSGTMLLTSCWKKPDAVLPPGVDYYTCSMHTFVHALAPGKCPVCGMNLIPVMKQDAVALGAAIPGPTEFTVSTDRQQQIGVTYATVQRGALRQRIRTVGTVDYDRQRYWAFVARTDGYVKHLYVTSPGEIVQARQPLLSLYSPDLFTAEREYVMLLGTRDHAAPDSLLASARGRLEQWNVTDEQIAELEKNRTPSQEVTLCSPFRGVVKDAPMEQGASVKAGDNLVAVVDLSRIWVWADFYEAEIAALHVGQRAAITSDAYPGETFEGEVALIDPFLDEGRRTFKVRFDIPNPDMKLRPGMYADVTLDVEMGTGLLVPLNAVMPTGTRNFVFVDRGAGRLEPREVTLGREFDGRYEVKDGVEEGERIVSSATFLIDAEAQIQGALKGFDGTEAGAQP
jgi:Cu(I)/Ag(I) efflux system membrane fusion protein